VDVSRNAGGILPDMGLPHVWYSYLWQMYCHRERVWFYIMMRSLWTAASGMKAQQTSLDTISHNLANINTTGYKKETVEFQSLLYQTIQEKTNDTNGVTKPIGAQVGLGVRVAAIAASFTGDGELTESDGDFDFGINGDGFFMIEMPDGSTAYTRNGHFVMAVDTNGMTLSTADGYPVLDTNSNTITFDNNFDTTRLYFDNYGNIYARGDDGNPVSLNISIGMTQFNNPSGLDKIGDSYMAESLASGAPRVEGLDGALKRSIVKHGYLEHSSVQAADEMVDMIITQRAYEMNSKAIQASDEMLQQANNLRS